MITARVHPGETPGSHVFNGMLKYILRNDARSKLLRDNFVMIPMLNPDAVYRGHYRVDTQGNNLNRLYKDPDPDNQPTIYACKELFSNLHQQNKAFFFCDLHAHASKKGIFMIGNHMDYKRMLDGLVFANLMRLNNPHFDLSSCMFKQTAMFAKDKRDGLSKEGSSRVALFLKTDFPRCFVLECNYNKGRQTNVLFDECEYKHGRR